MKFSFVCLQIKVGETAAVIARELAEQTKSNLQAGDITYTVKAMVQLVDLLDVQLRNLTPGGKDSAARSLNKVQRKKKSKMFFVRNIKPALYPPLLKEYSHWRTTRINMTQRNRDLSLFLSALLKMREF